MPGGGGDGLDARMTPELEDLFAFLRFPSISTDSRNAGDVRACAEWLVAKLSGMGLEAKLHATDRHPVVVAKNEHKPGKKTVLMYGHYDVQPVKEAEWTNPPFLAKVENGRIYGRGATDDKGGLLIPIWATEAMLKQKKK